MRIFSYKTRNGHEELKEISCDEWGLRHVVSSINSEFLYKQNWDVIVPQHSGFLSHIDKKFLDTLSENIIIDCVSSEYPISIDSYHKVFETFVNKNVHIFSVNILLYGYDNHYFYDTKIRYCNFVINNSIIFDEISKGQSNFLRNKKYLFLTNHIRYERFQMLENLHNQNHIKDGLVGFPSINRVDNQELVMVNQFNEKYVDNLLSVKDEDFGLPYDLDFFRFDGKDHKQKHLMWNGKEWSDLFTSNDFNLVLYFNIYFEIFSESYFYRGGYMDAYVENHNIPQYIQISEKTLKPILNLVPFLCLTDAGYYKKLKEMGLKFNSNFYYDLSWDELRSGEEKVKQFNKYVNSILKNPKKILHEWYYNSINETIENKKTFISIMNSEIERLFL